MLASSPTSHHYCTKLVLWAEHRQVFTGMSIANIVGNGSANLLWELLKEADLTYVSAALQALTMRLAGQYFASSDRVDGTWNCGLHDWTTNEPSKALLKVPVTSSAQADSIGA